MKSDATTPDAYLARLPADRRAALTAVRSVILQRLPEGYVEAVGFGMLSYEVPLTVHPNTYNKKPLMYAALASQKNHMAVYLCNVYEDAPLLRVLEQGFARAGKKLDMGASCVRFKKLEDLPLDVIGEVIAATPVAEHVARERAAHSKEAKAARKPPAKKRT